MSSNSNRGGGSNTPAAQTPPAPAAPADQAKTEAPAAQAKTEAQTEAETEAPAEVTEYEVAPGRTVNGKGPGQKVALEDDDALRLFKLGFILDEDGNRAGLPEGPKTAAGVEIKEV